jgi:hypothetical protein
MRKPNQTRSNKNFVVMIQDKTSNLVTRYPVEADSPSHSKAIATEEKGETHNILSVILFS